MTRLGTAALGQVALAQAGPLGLGTTIPLPPPGDGCVLVGTDNGFIVKRRNDGTYVVVYSDPYDPASNPDSGNPHTGAHCYRSLQMEQVNAVFNDVSKVMAQAEDEFSSGAVFGIISSSDGGDTWAQIGPAGPYPPLQTLPNEGGKASNGELWAMDEDGHLWTAHGINPFNNPPFHWFKSTDYTGEPFNDQFAVGSFNQISSASSLTTGNYIWSIHRVPPGVLTLYRQDAVSPGGNFTSFAVPSGHDLGNEVGLYTQHGTNRLIVAGAQHFTDQILSIDVTNPLSPVLTWGVLPGGTNQVTFGTIPVTNQILIAAAWNSTQTAGAIHRSIDGGTTWTTVLANTTDLKLGVNPFTLNPENGVEEDTQRIATFGGTDVWLATATPQLLHSEDAGATWNTETVDMSIFGATPPVHWLSIALMCSPPPPTTSFRIHRRPFAAVIA